MGFFFFLWKQCAPNATQFDCSGPGLVNLVKNNGISDQRESGGYL